MGWEVDDCVVLLNGKVIPVEPFNMKYQIFRQFGDFISFNFVSDFLKKYRSVLFFDIPEQ